MCAKAYAKRIKWVLDRFVAAQEINDERLAHQWERMFIEWFDGDLSLKAMNDRGYSDDT